MTLKSVSSFTCFSTTRNCATPSIPSRSEECCCSDVSEGVASKCCARSPRSFERAKYLPIIFDFDRPRDRNYTETVKTLVGLSRFVIVDMSGPSVPQELYATVPHFKIPFIPIIEEGRPVYAMFADLLEYPWVLR